MRRGTAVLKNTTEKVPACKPGGHPGQRDTPSSRPRPAPRSPGSCVDLPATRASSRGLSHSQAVTPGAWSSYTRCERSSPRQNPADCAASTTDTDFSVPAGSPRPGRHRAGSSPGSLPSRTLIPQNQGPTLTTSSEAPIQPVGRSGPARVSVNPGTHRHSVCNGPRGPGQVLSSSAQFHLEHPAEHPALGDE